MTTGDIALLLTAITGAITGGGALWLGWRKHQSAAKAEDNEVRIGDAEARIVEWAAINDRVNADNVRLRGDNDHLRADNDRLRNDLHNVRSEVAAVRKGWREKDLGLPEPPEEP